MPAHLMDDGEHKSRSGRDLFGDFASVADSTARLQGVSGPGFSV